MFPLALRGLAFGTPGKPVLANLDLDLSGEGISVVLGPNGAGKTVLLRILAGLLPPSGGSLDWGGVTQPKERVAMVFQQPMVLRLSVLANVAFALEPRALASPEKRQRALAVLERVGLADRAGESARLLSGGERQRLALARAWVTQPRFLMLDEPTASLDPGATEAVERIIREIRTDGTKILMTTHNLGQATRLADDIVFLAEGRVQEHEAANTFFARPRSAAARAYLEGELPWRIAFDR
ncbi:MAG TPA: ATP-binding cassette domain-containing protein [Rhodocyclaceae bacterium]|jgi:tungstate transport system ATP-binding protein|nr:ATP-binding cassette domain-containing protein [Rhodocyclaceae bacterium]HMW78348.1 ATP-binding cassette domain-containing protein [Rhodocyclaceae bacterium]HNE43132.1 ATP-binding cassette domain-containing protein [Rhodocyclaceae bacterium]HNL20796.1 ATP-binding cassette domain-containing protein [Rhodocyclaceae bacterium]HNM22628.1 ATP-binding cassette domain-containing protein [Rhodocyclaceae bacterium]